MCEKIKNKKMENRAGGRSENLGREATIQALLKEEVLLLIRPKSGALLRRPCSLYANTCSAEMFAHIFLEKKGKLFQHDH